MDGVVGHYSWKSTIFAYLEQIETQPDKSCKIQLILYLYTYLEQTKSVWEKYESFFSTMYYKTLELKTEPYPEVKACMNRFIQTMFSEVDPDSLFVTTTTMYLNKIHRSWELQGRISSTKSLCLFIIQNRTMFQKEQHAKIKEKLCRKFIGLKHVRFLYQPRQIPQEYANINNFLDIFDKALWIVSGRRFCKSTTATNDLCKKYASKTQHYCPVHQRTINRVKSCMRLDIPEDLIGLICKYGIWYK
jgi:hypothetical protein